VLEHRGIGKKTPTVLAALARQEIAIERVVVLAEEYALAPGDALSSRVGEGRPTTGGAPGTDDVPLALFGVLI
jgi:hypothetical protein